MTRDDASAKASGVTRYVGDIFEGRTELYHATVVRSTVASGRIQSIDVRAAMATDGVIGVYTAADVSDGTFGRALEDIPILASDRVRFIGDRVCAVVARTREIADAAASSVVVTYDELVPVTTIDEALAPDAPAVHDTPWAYPGATAREGDPVNVVFHETVGSLDEIEAALAHSAASIDATYTTPGVHQGYLEPQAVVADYESTARVRLWYTNKAQHRLRTALAHCLGLEPDAFVVEPMPTGGDFGGKGAPGEAPLCIELSRITGHPVKLVLRYTDDLIAGNPRHPSRIRVRMGCDDAGLLTAVAMDIVMNGGAYGGCTPSVAGTSAAHFPSYRTPVFYADYRRVYTNTVPRGFMRAPGDAQSMFALESAIDELAHAAGVDAVDFRRRNLLSGGDADYRGKTWVEQRGVATLDLAMRSRATPEAPPGWLVGTGVGLYSRVTPVAQTSLRLVPTATGGVCVEVPVTETGTGSHTAMRSMVADALGLPAADVEVVQVGTDALPFDAGIGGSRTTSTYSVAADVAAKAWHNRLRDEPVLVEVQQAEAPAVGSYAVEVVTVAIDAETGELRLLDAVCAVDVAAIISERAHQMQIDGGAVTGFGFACLEDLDESDGHVWAANLGEYRLPSSRDVPPLRTVLLRDGVGVGTANVKAIGELTTPPFAPAVANAVFAATGARIRTVPLTSERILAALSSSDRGRD